MSKLTHKETLERFQDNWEADQDNRDDGMEDLRFRAGNQWTDAVRSQREADGRPVLTINRMGQFIKRVSGGLRQSHPAIEAIPSDDESDGQLADIYEGLIRQIEYASNAGAAYAWGAECAITCGIGHWRIDTCYSDDGSFNQEIRIKRILDPLSVVWDASSEELDRSDAWECFVTEMVTKQEFERRWPKEKDENPGSFPVPATYASSLLWQADKRIRVASRWFKTAVKRRIGQTADGQVFDITKWPRDLAVSVGIVRDRVVDDYKVQHVALSGDDFLTDVEDWAGRHIPIVPVVGDEVVVDGKAIRHGIVRFAKDAQRLYNYYRSAGAEAIGMAPKAPWLIPVGSIDGYENDWARANSGNPAYLMFKPVVVDGIAAKPERMQPPAQPSAMWQESQIAQDDMKATTGIYDAALGARSNETSGIAIEQRQQEADTGSFVYIDNFNGAIKRTGQILIDLIPRVYDGERVVRVLGKGAEEGFVPINKVVLMADGQEMLVNDLSAGSFDVRIKTGPSYANAKQQAREALNDILKSDPQLMTVVGDLWAQSLELPGEIGGPIVDRLKKILAPGIVPPEQGGQALPQPPQPPPEAQAALQLDLQLKEANIARTRAAADGQMLRNEQLAEALGLHPGAELSSPMGDAGALMAAGAPA